MSTIGETRTKKSEKNVAFAAIGFFVKFIFQFILRMVFIRTLTNEYLGISGLFSGILSMLSLSELGVGSAIIYALYKPVADNDIEKIKSLMNLYKKLYSLIGCFILVIGLILTPFLQFLVKEMPDIENLRLYYVLYVIDVAISYFYAYKRSLIICYQEEYISTLTMMLSTVLTKGIQIIILLLTRNYLLFLCIQIVFTRLENVIVSKIADKKYPYLRDENSKKLGPDEKRKIKKNIFAMMSHKVGSVVVQSTDNLIISKILGLATVGLYSNYVLIIDNVTSFVAKIIYALSPSIGNLVASESVEKSYEIFRKVLFINFWVYSLCACCLINLIQPFIILWLGVDYIMSYFTVIVLALCFYIFGMRNCAIMFREASGTFYNDRFKPIIESVVNIVTSIPLAYYLGAAGVKLGTIISTVTVAIWMEAYVLYKNYFKRKVREYYFLQIFYLLMTTIATGMTYYINSFVVFDGFLGIIAKLSICMIIPNAIYIIVFWNRKEFVFLRNSVGNIVSRYKKKLIKK